VRSRCYPPVMRSFLVFLCFLPGCSTVVVAPRETPVEVSAEGLDGLWVLQIRRQRWQPRDIEFVLRIESDGSGTATSDPVFIGRTTASLSDLDVDGDAVRFSLHSKVDHNLYQFEGRREEGTIDGVVRWHDDKHEQTEPFSGYRREVRRFDGGIQTSRFPIQEDPGSVGVAPVLLDRLLIGAETARSDALLVVAEGQLVAARTFGGSDDTTSVASLGRTVASAGGQGHELRPSDIAAFGQDLLESGRWTTATGSPWTTRPDRHDPKRSDLGFGHVSSSGEALLMYPEARLVVVRTVRRVENPWDRRYDGRDQMEWLGEMADTIALEKLGRDEQEPQ
jgi:hypothetical protein